MVVPELSGSHDRAPMATGARRRLGAVKRKAGQTAIRWHEADGSKFFDNAIIAIYSITGAATLSESGAAAQAVATGFVDSGAPQDKGTAAQAQSVAEAVMPTMRRVPRGCTVQKYVPHHSRPASK